MNCKIKYLFSFFILFSFICLANKNDIDTKNLVKPLIISIKGTILEEDEKKLIKIINPFGFLLARHNMKNYDQVKKLIAEIKELLQRDNIFFAIDQEGGSINRLKYIKNLDKFESKHMSYFGNLYEKDKKLALKEAKKQALIYAEIMKDIGFNLDFAPVVDLYNNENIKQATTTIPNRTISKNPNIVIAIAKAFNNGLKKYGIFGCLKHFPGLGSEYVDTHIGISKIDKNFKKIQMEDLVPFKKLSDKFMFIMVNLAIYKDIDNENPAIFSKKIINILRNDLKFNGFIITDGLDMGALNRYSKVERVLKSLEAGVDIAMSIYYSDKDLLTVNEQIPKDVIISFNEKLNKLIRNKKIIN